MRVHLHADDLLIEQAYSSASGLIDPTKDFYPFGEKPKFNDTLYLALEQAFANAGATATVKVRVTNPDSEERTPKPAHPSEDLKLRWEIWNGTWVELGTSTRTGPVADVVNGNPFKDTTNA